MEFKVAGPALVVLVSSILLSGCGQSSDHTGQSEEKPVDQALLASNPARAMVDRFKIGSSLESMAVLVAKRTSTYGMVAEKHGTYDAEKVVTKEIQELLPSYQDKWDANLANAYANNLTAEELKSLAAEGKKSQYFLKLREVQNQVGEEMQKNSSSVLTALVSEAMNNAIQ